MRPVNFGSARAALAAFVLLAAGPVAAQDSIETIPPPDATAPVVSVPAPPATPIEAAIKAWVQSIDASADWQASVGGVEVDAANAKATVTDLSVTSAKPGFDLTFARVTVDGFQPSAPGTFAAREIDIDNGRIDAGVYSLRVDHAALQTPVLPSAAGFAWDDTHPFASAVKLFAPLAQVTAAGATAGTLTVVETIDGVETWSTYKQAKAEGIHGGKIALFAAGPLRTDSPGADPELTTPVVPPLVSMTAATAETRDIDLNAMFAVYDPDRYPGGVGDGVWRTAVGHTIYRSVGIDIPSIKITIDEVGLDNFSMRQTKAPPDFDAPPPAPSGKISDIVRSFRSAAPYGVGRFALTNLNLATPGIDQIHLGKLTLTQASIDAVGSLLAEDIAAGVPGQGTVKIGKVGFGGLSLPPLDTVANAIDTEIAGGDIDISALIPPIGNVEAGGVDVALNALPPMQLGHLRVDLGGYTDDKVPTTISLDLAGLNVPASAIPDPFVQRLLDSFSYDHVNLDAGAKVEWSAAGDIAVRDFHAGMKDVGVVSGEADLAGLTPADATHVATVNDVIDKLSINRGTATFKDDSIVRRVLTAQATKLNTDPARFREQFAKGLPFMLMFLGDRALQTQLAPVLQNFIAKGGSITATAAPATPVALSAIIDAAKTAPFGLFGTLSVTVSGEPGSAPAPAPTPAPAE